MKTFHGYVTETEAEEKVINRFEKSKLGTYLYHYSEDKRHIIYTAYDSIDNLPIQLHIYKNEDGQFTIEAEPKYAKFNIKSAIFENIHKHLKNISKVTDGLERKNTSKQDFSLYYS